MDGENMLQQKIKICIGDFFSKCDQTAHLVTCTEEIPN